MKGKLHEQCIAFEVQFQYNKKECNVSSQPKEQESLCCKKIQYDKSSQKAWSRTVERIDLWITRAITIMATTDTAAEAMAAAVREIMAAMVTIITTAIMGIITIRITRMVR